MSTAVRSNYFRETMPQTVPSAEYNSSYCDYSAFTTDFDLSLLPESPESEVPLSPANNLSPYSYLYPSSPPMFSTNLEDGIFCDSLGFVNVKAKITAGPEVKSDFDDETLHTPLKKTPSAGFFNEKVQGYKEKDEKFEFYKGEEKNGGRQQAQQQTQLLIPTTVQATAAGYYPLTIKQEPSFGVEYCRSPDFQATSPSSSATASPSPSTSSSSLQSSSPSSSPFGIKSESAIDLKEAIRESHISKSSGSDAEQYATLRSLLKSPCSDTSESSSSYSSPSASSSSLPDSKVDHQLLRSVLRDTSFQKKFNIKPFDLPKAEVFEANQKNVKMEDESAGVKPGETSEIVEELTSEKIEPVFSLAIEQLRKDVDNTCNTLGISSDPTQWTEEDVKAWLLWTVRQFSLPLINPDCFKMDGATFCRLSEEDFQQRAPQSSSTLHAHLEIWKAASSCGECSNTPSQDLSTVQWSPTMHSSGSSTGGDLTEDEDDEMDCSISSPQSKSAPAGLHQSTKEPSTSAGKAGKSGSSGTHIHLWQFLKELLASPQAHGSCIRWLDRQKGVFKIEDSVRVARLWGKRKNRPAMNYDKLSRSIRQYYKKGIMKKTERSQRLVYQFCHPYSL